MLIDRWLERAERVLPTVLLGLGIVWGVWCIGGAVFVIERPMQALYAMFFGVAGSSLLASSAIVVRYLGPLVRGLHALLTSEGSR